MWPKMCNYCHYDKKFDYPNSVSMINLLPFALEHVLVVKTLLYGTNPMIGGGIVPPSTSSDTQTCCYEVCGRCAGAQFTAVAMLDALDVAQCIAMLWLFGHGTLWSPRRFCVSLFDNKYFSIPYLRKKC